jgi:hypothetical protein
MERCSCIILHSCKNHELLLMSFPCSCWNPPGSQTSLWSFPCAPFCCCCCCAAAATALLLSSCSSLAVSADFNISSMISMITSSSCSSGWFYCCSLLSCKKFWPLGRSSRSPTPSFFISNFTCWMCMPCTFTFSSRASN